MEYTSVSNPKYVNEEGTIIECTVNFVGLGEVPFAASQSDVEAHGVEIFNKAKAGDFGPVTAFVPHVPTADEIRAAFLKDRTAQVAALTVTTTSGKVFNGDEVSQSRMARAIIASGIVNETTTHWTLANNVSSL